MANTEEENPGNTVIFSAKADSYTEPSKHQTEVSLGVPILFTVSKNFAN